MNGVGVTNGFGNMSYSLIGGFGSGQFYLSIGLYSSSCIAIRGSFAHFTIFAGPTGVVIIFCLRGLITYAGNF